MTTFTECQINHRSDHWCNTSVHHHHVERIVHPAIVELVKWATEAVPPGASSKVLDDAAGIGTVTKEIKKHFPDVPVLAVDFSPGMLKVLSHKAQHHGYKDVTTKLLNAEDLTGVPSNSITHAFACTFIDLAHDPAACIRELYRVLAPSGILAINTWSDPYHSSIGQPWTKACQRVNPGYKAPPVTNPKWSTTEQIKGNLEQAGFKEVETRQIVAHWRWQSAEEMVTWFFEGGNPVEGRWIESWVDEHGGKIEDVRKAFVEEVEKDYERQGEWLTKGEEIHLSIARK